MIGKITVALFAAAVAARAETTYIVTDLGTLGGESSRAYAINAAGDVVGESETASRRIHAFIWRAGKGMTDLGTLGGPTSRAYDINTAGAIVGEAATTSGLREAFVWSEEAGPAGSGASMMSIGTALRPFASCAYAINDAGLIAGAADTSEGSHAIVWSNLVPAQVDVDSSGYTIAYDINVTGYMAGQLDRGEPDNRVSAAFIHRPSEPSTTLLPAAGGLSSSATCMNNLNQAAGYLETTNDETHAFTFDGVRGLRDIDTQSNAYSSANAINSAGDVVGVYFHRRDDDEHAFIYSGAFADLNERITNADWILVEAADINDAGQIVGYGRVGDAERAFLLTPETLKYSPDPP